jgi:hypothetical protein
VEDELSYEQTKKVKSESFRKIGFEDPLTALSYTPALYRQAGALLTSNKEADYSLFDTEDRPV